MNTLTSPPLAPLLARLYAEADADVGKIQTALADLNEQQQHRLLQSKDGYRELYGRLKDVPLPVSPETGKLLYVLAISSRARNIVEFGTSFGISTLHLAAALRDNGGGRLISTEFEPGKIAIAQRNLEQAGLAELVELRAGDALQTLSADLPDSIDLLLLDGAKGLYVEILDLVEPRLRPDALIVADDAEMSPDYRRRMLGGGYLTLSLAGGVDVSRRLG